MKRDNPKSDGEKSINRTWQPGGQCPKRKRSHEKTSGRFKLRAVSTGRKREELVRGGVNGRASTAGNGDTGLVWLEAPTCRALGESSPSGGKEGEGKRLREQSPSERLLVNLGGEAIA